MNRPTSSQRLYVLAATIAVAAGIFFRFWDLAGAPLAVDEYFFGRSIMNIAERGLPEFACGGYYGRGVLIQYLSVPFLLFGSSLEFTTRFWPAVASLLSIAAVWKIARLAGGIKSAAVALILVSLSVWEVEFARFGRMYSPFQAIFLWYVYFQILHLVNDQRNARWVYLALSGISVFVYAGASFMLLLNFLPVLCSGKRWSIGHLLASAILLVCGTAYFIADLRHLGVPAEPPAHAAGTSTGLSLPINIPPLPETGGVVIIVLAALFLGYILLRYRSAVRWSHPSVIFWLLATVLLGCGMFSFGLGLIAAGLLLQLPSPFSADLAGRFRLSLALPALLAIWLCVLALLFAANDDSPWLILKNTLSYTLNYPDIYYYVLLPWLQAIPVTTILLATGTALQVGYLVVKRRKKPSAGFRTQRYIAATLILLLMLAAFFDQPYTITRYTYFLYPLILILVASAITYWSGTLFEASWARVAATIVPLIVLFALSEDFRLGHLIQINEPQFRYRLAYDDRLANHYYLRWDFRSAANFVDEHLRSSDSVIVFDFPLPYYLDRTTGIYVREGSNVWSMVWACEGEREVWSNERLLDTAEVHDVIARTSGDVWLIMRSQAYRSREPLESSLPLQYGLKPVFVSQDSNLVVYRLPHG